MAKKKTARPKPEKKGLERPSQEATVKKPEESLEQLGKLSKEELLIRLGQLMSENAALRARVRVTAKTTRAFRSVAQQYLRQPLEDTMKDYED